MCVISILETSGTWKIDIYNIKGLRFLRGQSCFCVTVNSTSAWSAPPLAGHSISSGPRLGALLEVSQVFLVIIIQHPHIAVGVTKLLEE